MSDYGKATDTQLIAACLDGEAEAWEELLKRYRRLIYSIPYKYGFSPDQAADIFQSVCVTMLEQLRTLRDERKLSSWLITTTLRECWKVKRREQREISNPDDEGEALAALPADGPLPDELVQTLEEQHLVRQAIQRLDDRCRALLTYLFYEKEEWSYERISRQLGMPVASIGPTRGRCLEKLKRILRKWGIS